MYCKALVKQTNLTIQFDLMTFSTPWASSWCLSRSLCSTSRPRGPVTSATTASCKSKVLASRLWTSTTWRHPLTIRRLFWECTRSLCKKSPSKLSASPMSAQIHSQKCQRSSCAMDAFPTTERDWRRWLSIWRTRTMYIRYPLSLTIAPLTIWCASNLSDT